MATIWWPLGSVGHFKGSYLREFLEFFHNQKTHRKLRLRSFESRSVIFANVNVNSGASDVLKSFSAEMDFFAFASRAMAWCAVWGYGT